jgi:hypothetical protein
MATSTSCRSRSGGKTTVGHHDRFLLGWMDGHTWYQLATLLSRSYCMVSSCVLEDETCEGGWNVVYLGRYPMGMWLCIISGDHSM